MIHHAFRHAGRAICISMSVLATTLPPGVALGSAPTDLQASQLITLVNNHRATLGRPALVWDQRLADVAQAHTEDMVIRGFFSHTNPDGVTFANRIQNANITFVSASENIAAGYSTAASVFSAWLLSPGHRSNIENAQFTHHGIGFYQNYWTHVFIQSPNASVGVEEIEPGTATIRLSAWPSPARTGGHVRFSLPAADQVTLRIVDVSGREVARPLDHATLGAGVQEIALGVERFDAGLYFVELRTQTTRTTTKLLVVR